MSLQHKSAKLQKTKNIKARQPRLFTAHPTLYDLQTGNEVGFNYLSQRSYRKTEHRTIIVCSHPQDTRLVIV